MESNEKRIFIFTCAAHYLTHFFILVFPALVMFISRDLSITADEVFKISFPMYLCYGILAIPWGYFSDKFNPRLIMGLGILVSGFGFLSTIFADNIEQLAITLSVVGIGCSAYHPSGLALLSKGIKLRGRALGINGLWGSFGIASAPLLAGLLGYLLGWKGALLVFGVIGISTGAVTLAVPFSVGNEDLQKSSNMKRSAAATLFITLCFVMLFTGLMYRGFTVILPTFFEVKLTGVSTFINGIFQDARITPDANTLIASIITSGVMFIGMIGQLFGGKAADSYDLRWSYFIFFICALPFLFVLSLIEGPLLVLFAGLYVLFAIGMQPIENSLVAVITPPRWRSISYGIKFTIIFGGGSLAVPIVSFIDGKYGMDHVISFLSLSLLIGILIILLLLYLSRGQEVRHEH